jgi:hypothetical protein
VVASERVRRRLRTFYWFSASGKRTKSELAGVGAEEFNRWILGAML